jgi:gluconolactonase
MRRIAFVMLLAASLLRAEQYSLGPDSQPQAGVPKGSVTRHELKAGAFYPGTPHTYSLYVPASYDAAKPTPFMIFLDGSAFLGDNIRVPVVLDNLIAKHELPAMIGIFVDPGVLPALSDQAQSRFERVFEYDSMSDRYARFLLEELIPEVEKTYNLSHNPDDRALSGLSTGAVCAFMAAWNRPEQFHRVLSFIGTYVAMKGADSLPALVRKTEPKPIRFFLQDGSQDHIVPAEPYGTFFAGSWPINNQVMFQALEYAGYDATLVIGDGGHDMKQGAAILPDALRWLWRGYPQPVEVHEPAAEHEPGWDPRGKVYSIVSADQPWQQVGATYHGVVGPAPDDQGNVFFADPEAGHIYRSDAAGAVTLFKDGVSGVRALQVGADGRIYASLPESKRIVSYGAAGDEKIVAEDVDADAIAVSKQGTVYFANQTHDAIGVIDAAGRGHTQSFHGAMAQPAALTLSPDQAMLIAADAESRFAWSFQITTDGSLLNGEPFYRLELPENGWGSGVGGVTEDSIGQVYFATPEGVQMCEANGRLAAILNPPEHGPVAGLAFGGKDRNWLYLAEGGKLFHRKVKVAGNAVSNPVKPPKPPL